jgi:hypothetical protein
MRTNSAQQERTVQELNVGADSVDPDVGGQGFLSLAGERGKARSLAAIPSSHSKHLFKQLRVATAAPFADTKVVLDNTLDDDLVQLCRNLSPADVRSLRERITTTLRECLECFISNLHVPSAVLNQAEPEFRLTPIARAILLCEWRQTAETSKCGNLAQSKWANLKWLYSSRQTVAASLNP